jgi:hypothetical protein
LHDGRKEIGNNTMNMLVKRIVGAFDMVAKPIAMVAKPVEVLSNIFNIGTFLFTIPALFFGYNTLSGVARSSQPLSFPLRLLILVGCGTVLGWGLGACIAYLTRRNTSATVVMATILACTWALLLVTIADSLTVRRAALPEFALFVLVGMALVMWLLTFQLRAQANFGNAMMVQDRTTMIAWFAATTLIAMLLVQLGGAA